MTIFLYGPDSYRIREKLRELEEKFIGKVDKSGLNITRIDGEKMKMDEFRKAAFSSGFLVEKRMVVVKNLIGKGKIKEVKVKVLEALEKMKGLESENVIVFIENTEGKKAPSGKLADFLKKQKYAWDFPLLSGTRLSKWIETEAAKKGGRISRRAVDSLAGLAGSDLWKISGELDKLIARAFGREITESDVALVAKGKVEDDIFGLVDAIGSRQKKKALDLLSKQAQGGSSWHYILSMMTRQFRLIIQAKDSLDRGSHAYALAGEIGAHPFVARKAAAQARNFTLKELKNIYRQLLEIDVRMKSELISPEVFLDLLIVKSG